MVAFLFIKVALRLVSNVKRLNEGGDSGVVDLQAKQQW
jgi:hypothetical protein